MHNYSVWCTSYIEYLPRESKYSIHSTSGTPSKQSFSRAAFRIYCLSTFIFIFAIFTSTSFSACNGYVGNHEVGLQFDWMRDVAYSFIFFHAWCWLLFVILTCSFPEGWFWGRGWVWFFGGRRMSGVE